MLKLNLVFMVSALCLTACANHEPTKNSLMRLPGVMSQEQNLELQRPSDPITHFVKWRPDDRLQKALVVDYIQGMSQHDYFFEEPNQELFRPMLDYALVKSDLAAPNKLAGRFGVQINFKELKSDAFGRHFVGRTTAQYRVVDRLSGDVVYENEIQSNFIAEYPNMGEREGRRIYNTAAPVVYGAAQLLTGAAAMALAEDIWNQNDGVRDFFGGEEKVEATQGEWNDFYQSLLWVSTAAVVVEPVKIMSRELNPANYISIDIYNKTFANKRVRVRNGALSKSGIASRDAGERARQLNAHLLSQSLTYFLLDLAASERTGLTQIVPCHKFDGIDGEMIDAMLAGQTVITDDCAQYAKSTRNRGMAISKP